MQKIRPLLVFFILSLIIVLSWFKSGLYYGGAEVGVGPYYHPSRYLDIQKFIWWDSTAPGMLVPQFISAVPLYFVLSLLQKIFSPLILQALLFFSLLFLMGYGMYLFALYLLGKDKKNYAVLAGLFYLFNSYVLVEVWHRFLYTGIFLAAAIPVLALFWQKWIKEGRFIFLTFFLLTNLAFSYMWGNLTSLIAVWVLCFLITIAEIVLPWQGKKVFLITGYKFTVGFLLFLLTNLWWIFPVIMVSTGVLPQQHRSEDNISTLVNISKQTILPYTLQLANPFYLFYTAELGTIYKNFIFLIIPWLPVAIIFIGLLRSLKEKYLAGFGIAYLLSVLLSKGAAQPFGYPYIWGFMNFYILGVLRNPFEKLGILMPFFGSLLFVIGLENLVLFSKRKYGNFVSKFLPSIILISILIYAFPMFTGGVFNKPNYPLEVKVPDVYEKADNWLKKQNNLQGNILHLPFPERDVVTYNWEYGYHGVEINEILFTALPSITRNVGIKRVDDTLKSFSFIFSEPFLNNDQILNILQSFNVGYIVLHKETRWDDVSTYGKNIKLNNPLTIEATLNSLDFLEKSVEFDDLLIYKLKDNLYQPKIEFINNFDLVVAGDSSIMQTLALTQSASQITSINKEIDNTLWEKSTYAFIFPETILYSWEPSKETIENMLNEGRVNPNDPSLPFSQLQGIKDRFFSQTGELLSEAIINKVILANSYILELNKNRLNNTISSKSILDNYDDQIEAIFTMGFEGSSLQRSFKPVLSKVFTIHLYELQQFYESSNNKEKQLAKDIYNKLRKYLVNTHVIPQFLSIGQQSDEFERRVHSFEVPKKADYELLITDTSMLNLYPEALSKLDIQVDDKPIATKLSNVDNIVHLRDIELDKGTHEVSYVVRASSNLAGDLSLFILEGGSQLIDNKNLKFTANPQIGSAATLVLPKTNGGDVYEITFEALVDNVQKFYIEMLENLEADDSVDNCSKTSCYTLEVPLRSKDWRKFSLTTTSLNRATEQVKLRVILPTNFSSVSSALQIRDFKVNRIMDNNLVLRKVLKDVPYVSTSTSTLTDFSKINTVNYKGKVKLDEPSFMFFKETFNPGWVLKLFNNKETFTIDKHYLGNLYGNTYYIDKIGEYDFSLEFESQKYIDYGIIGSIGGWIGVLVMLVYSEFRRKYEN